MLPKNLFTPIFCLRGKPKNGPVLRAPKSQVSVVRRRFLPLPAKVERLLTTILFKIITRIKLFFELFRSLQLQFSGPTGIIFRYSYSFVGLAGICL